MSVNQHMVDHMKWSVYWQKKGKWVRKRFYDDVGAAIRFYADRLDRPGITLHCDNMAFPPPKAITEYRRQSWKIVRIKGKKFKKKVFTVINLMEEYNQKGVWWCPYCIKLRRFTLTETERGPEMYCPVCGCGNYIATVRRHNPHAAVIEMHKRQQRTSSGKRRKR